MNRLLFCFIPLCVSLLAINASAEEAGMHHEAHGMEVHTAPIHSETGFYTAIKALMTLGDTADHGEGVTLEGKTGRGIGVELGYKIGYGFAVESDATYARNTVNETNCAEGEVAEGEGEAEGGCHYASGTGKYTTVSIDLAYNYHVTHHMGVFAKTGYEYEEEDIDELDIHANDTGFIYAVGAEYAISENAVFMAEYEGTTIEGPRGHSLFAGVAYHF